MFDLSGDILRVVNDAASRSAELGYFSFTVQPVLVGLSHPLMYRTGAPRAVPDSRYSYPQRDSELSFV